MKKTSNVSLPMLLIWGFEKLKFVSNFVFRISCFIKYPSINLNHCEK
jgi:hypothetical protein